MHNEGLTMLKANTIYPARFCILTGPKYDSKDIDLPIFERLGAVNTNGVFEMDWSKYHSIFFWHEPEGTTTLCTHDGKLYSWEEDQYQFPLIPVSLFRSFKDISDAETKIRAFCSQFSYFLSYEEDGSQIIEYIPEVFRVEVSEHQEIRKNFKYLGTIHADQYSRERPIT